MEKILPPLDEEDKFIAGLEYIFWFVISVWVLLSSKKREPFLFFHGFQSLFLGLTFTIITFLAVLILFLFFSKTVLLPYFSASLVMTIGIIFLTGLFLAESAVVIYCAYKASEGKEVWLPYITKWTEQLYQKRFK